MATALIDSFYPMELELHGISFYVPMRCVIERVFEDYETGLPARAVAVALSAEGDARKKELTVKPSAIPDKGPNLLHPSMAMVYAEKTHDLPTACTKRMP
ncbi:hypothetical protein [uncultured Aliiroseovarius sp.]|uniref:hypothetical protein n=1 Tax=uncultured Aliiroseovarius sp. TaxID=1658783 RepID=UPI002593FCCB|nr:hypothetical protein [uncultured Aliiroseovarius sp.]